MNEPSKSPGDFNEERLSRLQLAQSDNIGPATYHQLIEAYGSAVEALAAIPHLASKNTKGHRIRLCSRDRAVRDVEATNAVGGQILCHGDAAYPRLLAQTVNPPPILYASGRVELLQQSTCAIVGSRNSSANGKRFARQVAKGLGNEGWNIASGLARGIDTAAHEASIEQGTIAVVATGLDVVYPPENEKLSSEVRAKGCIVTEMPPGTQPRAELFPRRNRIIAGLAAGVVVIEAALRSGSLITARLANEIGRDVFAVPGSPFDPRSAGTNKLIQDGAMLITSYQDIMDVLERGHLYSDSLTSGNAEQHSARSQTLPDPESNQAAQQPAGQDDRVLDDSHRKVVVELLGPDPVEVNVVVREAGLSPRLVQMVMIELDLAGRLERHSGQRVSLIA